MICENCKREAPTWNINFYQITGFIVLFSIKQVNGYLCKECIEKYYQTFTNTTLLLGWWSIISIATPFILINNFINYRKVNKPPEENRNAIPSKLSDEVVNKLSPFSDEIEKMLFAGDNLARITSNIAPRAQVKPAEVELFIAIKIFREKLLKKKID